MKWLFVFLLFFITVGCKYKAPKASFTIVEVDTIAIDKNVLINKTVEDRE